MMHFVKTKCIVLLTLTVSFLLTVSLNGCAAMEDSAADASLAEGTATQSVEVSLTRDVQLPGGLSFRTDKSWLTFGTASWDPPSSLSEEEAGGLSYTIYDPDELDHGKVVGLSVAYAAVPADFTQIQTISRDQAEDEITHFGLYLPASGMDDVSSDTCVPYAWTDSGTVYSAEFDGDAQFHCLAFSDGAYMYQFYMEGDSARRQDLDEVWDALMSTLTLDGVPLWSR